jgi:hypothetical protein
LKRLSALAVLAIALSGCTPHWVNPRITDPAAAKTRLSSDSTYCRQIENMLQRRVDIQERVSFDPTVVGQMSNYYHNYQAEKIREDVFDKCMRDRGWTKP